MEASPTRATLEAVERAQLRLGMKRDDSFMRAAMT